MQLEYPFEQVPLRTLSIKGKVYEAGLVDGIAVIEFEDETRWSVASVSLEFTNYNGGIHRTSAPATASDAQIVANYLAASPNDRSHIQDAIARHLRQEPEDAYADHQLATAREIIETYPA